MSVFHRPRPGQPGRLAAWPLMYIYIYIYIHTYTRASLSIIYIYKTNIYIHIYTHIVYIYIYIHISIYIYIYIYIYLLIFFSLSLYIYIYIYTHTRTPTDAAAPVVLRTAGRRASLSSKPHLHRVGSIRKTESIHHFHHHHHPEGVVYRISCLNSGTAAVSKITSRRWCCMESRVSLPNYILIM